MPLLKMDKKGNIVQSDSRFDGVHGIGAVADMVDQGDMYELSLEPNADYKKAQRDREALRKLQVKSHEAKVRKYAQDKLKQQQMEVKRAAALEKKYQQKKQELYKNQLMQNSAYLAAKFKGGNVEKLSGVSGFGVNADGRQPDLSQAATDYQPILQANEAFGGDTENWGNETGLGYHSNDEVNKHQLGGINTQMGELSYSPEKVDQKRYLRKDKNPINEASQAEVVNEAFTSDDEYALRQFLDGTYVVKLYKKGHPGVWNKVITDDHFKNQINSRNNSWNHSAEFAKFIAQGWGYSILDNGKEYRLVKVPYYWGLPMYVPDNPRNMYTGIYFSKKYSFPGAGPGTEFRNGTVMREDDIWPTMDQALYPVILAAAKEYAQHSDEYGVWQGREFQKKVLKEAKTQSSGGGFFQKLFSKSSPNYQHPFLKQGLLK